MFSVDFYREEDGSKPVGTFIRNLDVKMKAKVVSDLHRLEMLGNEARAPLSKHLEDDIFELRSICGNDIVRILYFLMVIRLLLRQTVLSKNSRRLRAVKYYLPRREKRII